MFWPMGHSYSAAVAQHTLLETVLETGVGSGQLLHDEHVLGSASLPNVALAIDDVNLFERFGRDVRMSDPSCLQCLDAVWLQKCIVPKKEKAVDRSLNATVLGMQIVNGELLLPKGPRLVQTVCALMNIIRTPRISPKDLSCFVGSLTFNMGDAS